MELRLTDPIDARAANALILALYSVKRMMSAEEMHTARKPPIHYRVIPPPELGWREDYEMLKASADNRLVEASMRYRYLAFAYDILKMGALAVLAFPPDLTWRPAGPLVKPWTWITWSFFNVAHKNRIHRNIITRHFTSSMKMRYLRSSGFLERYPVLETVFREKEKRYIERGHRPSRAKALAFRDIHRIILGCTWLIATIEAYEAGKISGEDIVLPYPLERHPELAERLVQPGDIDDRFSAYTWRALLEAAGRA